MRGAATQAMLFHRRGAATKQLPARGRGLHGTVFSVFGIM
jgi:hypothetical protein